MQCRIKIGCFEAEHEVAYFHELRAGVDWKRGSILGYKRGKCNQYPSTSLIQIEGVNTVEEVDWYLGKRIAYVYKAKTKKNGTLYRAIWGRVTKPHENSGVVRAKFRKDLPPSSLGGRVRVFMYPSRI
ncbi:hypothetical protein KP509_21G069900 [Ceratopteris richardii]|uniref:60S ribosomal protein L35a n=1 Tax=Ceratopteris richardii TaxID=49495 RepID=A0A8T2SD48_CERRI|nr:hypothetical protein KP509_21G069900 [Ceratopteris richardii]